MSNVDGLDGDDPPAPGRGLNLGVLGPITAHHGGQQVTLGGPKERCVLAVLVAAERRTVPVDALIDAVWGDTPPATAERTLQAYVARLRRALDPQARGAVIATSGRGYALVVSDDAVDAWRFAKAAAAGRAARTRGDPAAALAAFDVALALWRGVAYDGVVGDRTEAARHVLDEQRRVVADERFEALLDLGYAGELVPELTAAAEAEPYRERRWAALMVAQYRDGRQTDALRTFQRARRMLADEVGLEPSAALREVEAAVLAQDDARLGVLIVPEPRVELPAALDPRASVCVGRAEQLSRLQSAWGAARAGAGGLLAVTGPEGAGKTRLIAELAVALHRDGAVIAYGRCDAAHRTARAVCDQTLRSVGGSLLAAQATAGAGLPLGVAVARQLAAWAAARPVLVVFDDLDQADADVLAVAHDIAGGVAGTGVLVVATFRTDNDDPTPAMANRIALAGLPRDDVALVCALYDDAWSSAEIDDIAVTTGGLPLAVHDAAAARVHDATAARLGVAASAARVADRRLEASQQALADEVATIRSLARRRREQSATRSSVKLPSDRSPYRGLRAFEAGDAPWFFGRERAIADVIAMLALGPAVSVVGASGSGKSSLVRAGVLPALADGALPGSDAWQPVVTTPGDDPLAALDAALDEPRGDGRAVLVVDQFEELFASTVGATVRDRFTELLAGHIDDGGAVIAVVRADHAAGMAGVTTLRDLFAGRAVVVGPLRHHELREAVEGPLAVAGLRAEDGLVDAVLADARGASEVLPLLQTALLATWQRRRGDALTFAAYRDVGGVRGAIARLAETTYGSLDPPAAASARRALLRLADAERDGPLDVRRPAPLAELVVPGDPGAERALAALVDNRLVTVDATTAEITHEALLREWPRLRGWLEENRAELRMRQRLAAAAAAWEAGDRDPSELLRGARLDAATAWISAASAGASASERDFVAASRAAAEAQLAAERARADREARSATRLRRRLQVAAALLVVAVLTAVAAAVQWDRSRGSADAAREARERAVAEAARAGAAEADAEHEAARALAAELTADARRLSAQALVEQDIDTALLLAVNAVGLDDRPETRAGLLAAVQRAPLVAAVGRLHNGARPQSLAVSPDGTLLAVVDQLSVLHILDAATFDELWTADAQWGVTFLPDGRLAYAVVRDGAPVGEVVVTDPRAPDDEVRLHRPSARIESLAVTPDGRWLVAAGANTDPVVSAWDLTARLAAVVELVVPGAGVDDLAALGDGLHVAVARWDGSTAVVDLDAGTVDRELDGGGAVAVDPVTNDLAVVGGSDDRTVMMYSGGSTEPASAFLVDAAVLELRFSPGGHMLAVGTSNGTELRRPDGTLLARLDGQAERSRGLAFAPQATPSSALYGASLDGTIVRWELAGERAAWQVTGRPGDLLGPDERIDRAAMSPRGDIVMTVGSQTAGWNSVIVATRDGTITRRDGLHGIPPRAGIIDLAWAPDASTYVTVAGDAAIRRWDAATGEQLAVWTTPGPTARSPVSVVFDPGGTTLAIGLGNDAFDEFPPADGPDVYVLAAVDLAVRASFDVADLDAAERFGGSAYVYGYQHNVIVLGCCAGLFGDELLAAYDAASGAELWRSPGGVAGAAFSSDGARIAVGRHDGSVELVDPLSGRTVVGPVAGHDGFAEQLGFSADDATLMTVGTDGLVRIWQADDLAEVGTIDIAAGSQTGNVYATFVDDGPVIALFDQVRTWMLTVDPAELTARICGLLGHDLGPDEWASIIGDRPYQPVCG